jgi:ABC-2 type transport system permease protein
VFYSIDLLPGFWQGVSMINPILYMVNAFRYGILGVSDVNPYVALGMILVFITILSAISLRMLARGKGIRH